MTNTIKLVFLITYQEAHDAHLSSFGGCLFSSADETVSLFSHCKVSISSFEIVSDRKIICSE